MDIFAGLFVLLLGAAIVMFVVSPRTARSLDTFAAGFLPYRGAGWPRGVQEEDPVRWSWSPPRRPDAGDGAAGRALDGPEVVEISGAEVPVPTALDSEASVHRAARRPT